MAEPVHDWLDIGYRAVVEEAEEFYVSFRVYEIGTDGTTFHNEDGQICFEFDQAAIYLRGRIKWDGCSDWEFVEQERCMIHFCGVEMAKNIGKLFSRLYDLACDLLPRPDWE